ncbi:MAG: hypothetical protein ACRENJ_07605, partial [Candidatus Eiseniibacteriota bacterium]
GPGARAAVTLVVAAGCLVASIPARGDGESGADTLGFRLETGATTDITSEYYYEDAFVDTTFLGRRLVDTPEARFAGVVYASLNGTRGGRRAAYQLQNELSLGNKVQRDVLSLSWRDDLAPDWRLAVAPILEWRHDRTFGRDQREWRGSIRSRVRRSFADGSHAAELGAAGDFARTSGQGSEFMLDRDAARAWIALDHLGLLGNEWRLGYRLATRVFPDSSERDHIEHAWEGRVRHLLAGGHALTLELNGQRRQTHRIVATTRDNFWQEEGMAEADLRAADRWGIRLRLEGEAMQYDLQDSTVFFDYQIVRARAAARYERGAQWTLAAGPRGEILTNRLNPGEAYREIGGALEFELIGARSLWNVTPAAGWRAYDAPPDGGLAVSLHSSYAFYGLDAFVDQPLAERLRLRTLASLRYEAHTDPSQDAASVYLSAQLLWSAR